MSRIITLLGTLVLIVGLASAALASQAASKAPQGGLKWADLAHDEEGAGSVVRALDLDPVGQGTLRVHGENRFATAAAISQAVWEPEYTLTVFLATGENFPDALAIGPSSFIEGPLLLTQRDALPSDTRAELVRLQPCLIVAVGGPNAISDAVLAEADAYTNPAACLE